MPKKFNGLGGTIMVLMLTIMTINPSFASELSLGSESEAEINSLIADQENNAGVELLGVDQPDLLPGSMFYFTKEWGRGLSNLFTFSDEGKAEKRMNQAAERLAEVQKLINDPKANEGIVKALSKYQNDLQIAQEKIASIKSDSSVYNELMNQAVDKYAAFAKVLAPAENISLEVNKEIVEEIYRTKQSVLDGFAVNLEKLNPSEEALANVLLGQPGSEFKDFRNLEVLNELAGRLPENAAEAVIKAQQKIQNNLINKFTEGANKKSGQDFVDYVMALKGNEAGHVAILDSLAKNTDLPDDVVAGFRQAKDAVASEFSQKMINHPAATEIMADLATGDIDKLAALEELADALPASGEVKVTLEAARQKGLDMAAEKITSFESVDDKINFLIKDGVPDVKSFTMLEQIQAKLTPDQQAQMAQVRNQAFKIFSDVVDNAENSDKLLERLAGDSPKDVELIAAIKQNLPAELSPKFDELAKKQLEKVESRLAEETDINKLIEMRSALDDSPGAQALMKNLSPQMIDNINKAQTEKISAILDQAQSAEEVVSLANQYNDLLAKYPDVALNIGKNNPELIKNLAVKQAEKIKNQLMNIGDADKLRETLQNLQAAGLEKLEGTLPPEVAKQITDAVKAKAKEAEKAKFMAEMQTRLGDKFDSAAAEKLFNEQVAKLMDESGGFPDEAKLAEMKISIEAQISAGTAEEQKKAMIQTQVEAELQKNASGNAPSAGDLTNQIMQREEVKTMTAPPTQEKIDEIKANMQAEAEAQAQQQAQQSAPAGVQTGPTAEQIQQMQQSGTPPASIPTGPTPEEIERMKLEAMQSQMP